MGFETLAPQGEGPGFEFSLCCGSRHGVVEGGGLCRDCVSASSALL